MLFLLSVVLVTASAFFLLRAVSAKRLQVESTLARIPGYGDSAEEHGNDLRSMLRRIGRITPGGHGTGAEAMRIKLAAAGWSRILTPEDVAGLKIVMPVGVYFICLLLALLGAVPAVYGVMAGLLGAGAAYICLPFTIAFKVRNRRDPIVAALPTVLDLLTLSVEAGMSFDEALTRLVRRLRGPLVDELALMQRDIQLGTSRSEALAAMAARVDAPEVTSFVRALNQADKLGVPLAQMLRTQADDLRNKLRNEAEEQAMKAPVKMLFPTVLLIFPAIFVVVLGPALIAISENL
jgi:tight adherence protein C